jgi:hypothetical protein
MGSVSAFTTVQDEFYAPFFRNKLYRNLEELQGDLDEWFASNNQERRHPDRTAMAKRRCRPSWVPSIWRPKRCRIN